MLDFAKLFLGVTIATLFYTAPALIFFALQLP